MGKKKKPPPPPNYADAYRQGLETELQYAPQFAQSEAEMRAKYDPIYAQEQFDLQQRYAPQQAQLMQEIQRQIDPGGYNAHKALGEEVNKGLADGYSMDPRLLSQVQQQIRGAQVARGNYLGDAPISAEGTQTGAAAQQLHDTRLAQAGAFLGLPTGGQTAAQSGAFEGAAAPNTSFQFIDRNAGTKGDQFSLQNYGNLMSYYKANQANNSQFGSGIGSLIGAVGGGLFGGFGGASAGAKLGGGIGGMFGGG